MPNDCLRRDILKSLAGLLPAAALDWSSLPVAKAADANNDFDAIVIGSGLGGLSCAAALTRQKFRTLVIEQHDKPGGYATTFERPGGFTFDVSLHSTTVRERDGIHNLIPGFPEITGVEFVPHPNLYRAIFPGHDFRVPQKDPAAYEKMLGDRFPDERTGIRGLMAAMEGVTGDIARFSSAQSRVDIGAMQKQFPFLLDCFSKTWGQVLDAHVRDPKLKAILSALCGYYGLPPSKLASIYYMLPTFKYMRDGGYYAKGRSQAISNAMVKFIEERGGRLLLNTRVDRILTKDGAAIGVATSDKHEYRSRFVVSNANAYDTFHKMIEPDSRLTGYLARMDRMTAGISSFQVFLGLKEDLASKRKLTDAEIMYAPDYDIEAAFRKAAIGDIEGASFGVMIYDNVIKGYSPPGKNTLTLIAIQGYDHWKPYEQDYLAGRKQAYTREKERMADRLIRQAEAAFLPGLRKAIEVMEVGTPLTNLRYTANYRGAIYGWDQTLDNAEPRRLGHSTPIANLYLSGAWTRPGGGYEAVLGSGIQCFGEIMAKMG